MTLGVSDLQSASDSIRNFCDVYLWCPNFVGGIQASWKSQEKMCCTFFRYSLVYSAMKTKKYFINHSVPRSPIELCWRTKNVQHQLWGVVKEKKQDSRLWEKNVSAKTTFSIIGNPSKELIIWLWKSKRDKPNLNQFTKQKVCEGISKFWRRKIPKTRRSEAKKHE